MQPGIEQVDRHHRGPSLLVVACVFAALFIASLVSGIALAGGDHIPSPFEPAASFPFFSRHAEAAQIAGFFAFCAAIPLGIFTATAVSRLRFLGLDVAGVHIALYGGLVASAMLAVSGLSLWAVAQTGITEPAARTLHLLAFATGGPGHVVPLGLLVAGLSISAGLTHRLPRWMMIFGLAVAAVAELSALVLVLPAAAYLLPAARLWAVAWMICAGAFLPRTLRRGPVGEW